MCRVLTYFALSLLLIACRPSSTIPPVPPGPGPKPEPEQPVRVEGVVLDRDHLSLKVGDRSVLGCGVTPHDAENRAVSWHTDDETVATVDQGEVNAVAVGRTVIWVESLDGGFTAECVVEVEAQEEDPGTEPPQPPEPPDEPEPPTQPGDVAWEFSDGVLTISGEGVLPYGYSPWAGLDVSVLYLPASVSGIGDGCFAGLPNLTTVVIGAKVPPALGENNFAAWDDTLVVPEGSLDAYLSHSAWRAAFGAITENR